MKIFASIDFETSNIERNSACAIGYVLFNSSKILKKKSYLIKPPKPEIYFTEIHGITWEMLKNKSNFDKVWTDAIQDLKEADIFFAHNASFDKSVLYACCRHYKIPLPKQPFKDTVSISRQMWNFKNNKLNTVCNELRIPLNHHDALSDAVGCAKIAMKAFELGYVI